ncbi:MAG: spore germination protein [Clostridiales bacterium]|jgi:spore germination protein KA|nr:spore germination protein [Clostridiales bacterium]
MQTKERKGGSIWGILRFDEADEEFELLESERGRPKAYTRPEKPAPREKPAPASRFLFENERRLRQEFRCNVNSDILLRRFRLGQSVDALAVCMNGMASGGMINDFILRQGMRPGCMDGAAGSPARFAMDNIFAQQESECTADWQTIKMAILDGKTAVFIEGDELAVLMDTRGYEKRGVENAQNEKVVKGPQEGFNESLRTNITLLRRIIKTDDFVCEFQHAGGKNNVQLAIAYRQDVVNPNLLKEVKRRLHNVRARMLTSDGAIERMTERYGLSPLPQVLSTERPDRTAAHIMQGHVAVLLEGSPTASVMPATLFTLMATSEDSYMRRPPGAILRMVRYIGAGMSILLPGYFMAVAMHHQGMLSTETIVTIIQSREMVFLPLGLEMLFLLWVFQLLREAGVRVPGSVGQSIGIIGGLVLGQAAVSANMVSTVVLIIAALAGLGNFTIPDYSTQIAASYFRIFLLLLGWAGGLLGLSAGIVVLTVWMARLKSYGVPFLAPVAPKTFKGGSGGMRGRINRRQRPVDYINTWEEGQ